MRATSSSLVLAGALALGLVSVACSDDDNGGTPDNTSSSSGNVPDAGPEPTPDASTPPDGSTPGCTFAGYVIGLVNGNTTQTASPDTTLGASCAESTSQDDFKALFP